MKTLERHGVGRCENGARPGGGRWAGLLLSPAGLAEGRRLPPSRTLLRLRPPEKRRPAYAPKHVAERFGLDLRDEEDRAAWEGEEGATTLAQLAILARREAEARALQRRKGQKPPKAVSARDPRLGTPTRRSFTPLRTL